MGNPDKHGYLWLTRVKGCHKRRFCFGCWYAQIKKWADFLWYDVWCAAAPENCTVD